MTDLLQDQIEDYVAGVMTEQEKAQFEEIIKSDASINLQVRNTQRLREVLLRNRVRTNVNTARAYINRPKKELSLYYTIGSFTAAASIILFLLSTPISLLPQRFDYRGDTTPISNDAQLRANQFEKAQKLIQNEENTTEAIRILESLKDNENVSRSYQMESKWMLTIAYLQADEPLKAEKVFSEIKCQGIECPYSSWDKTKITWQIFLKKL